MKNSSNRTPPLLRGALALMGLILLALGGFSLWQWYRTRPLRAAWILSPLKRPCLSICPIHLSKWISRISHPKRGSSWKS